jgi:excisionase family DNA binding protein
MTPLLTIRDAARILAVSPRTITRLIAAGKMRHTRIGRQIRLDEQAVQDYLKAHTVRVAPLRGRRVQVSHVNSFRGAV